MEWRQNSLTHMIANIWSCWVNCLLSRFKLASISSREQNFCTASTHGKKFYHRTRPPTKPPKQVTWNADKPPWYVFSTCATFRCCSCIPFLSVVLATFFRLSWMLANGRTHIAVGQERSGTGESRKLNFLLHVGSQRRKSESAAEGSSSFGFIVEPLMSIKYLLPIAPCITAKEKKQPRPRQKAE